MNPAELRRHLPLWDMPREARVTLLNVSENMTFRADCPGRSLILRLHRPGYHSAAEIRSELDWLAALRAARVLSCATPLPGRDGRLIQSVPQREGARHMVAFAPIEGTEPDPASDLCEWFAGLGEITARLHAHARRWRRPPGFVRKRWDVETILGPRPHWGDWRAAPGLEPEGKAVLERLATELRASLARYGTGTGRFGLIHADLRLANLLLGVDRIWVIDFDDCGFGWWMYDFAAAISFIEDDPRVPALAGLWTEGYARVTPLAPEDVAMLPALVMLRRLLLTAWVGSHAESDTVRALGPRFAPGTVALAERYLSRGPAGFWAG